MISENSLQIEVLYFASLREMTQTKTDCLTLPLSVAADQVTIRVIKKAIESKYTDPNIADLLTSCMFSID
jgi:hypothetical protein